MPNLIRVYVEDPDALLNAGMYDAGAIIRLQSCATETGIYANESTAALVTAQRTYTLYDADGASSTWYRTRYENSGGTVTSDWSAVFQVGGEAAGYLCSLSDVRQLIPGLAITDTSFDEDLASYIEAVTDEIIGRCERQFVPDPASGTKTVYLDHPGGDRSTLWLPGGIRSVTYLGVASSDQPDAGSGTYTEIAAANYYLDPPAHERSRGWPATRISLASGYTFYPGKRTVKLTGAFGWSAPPPRVAQIAARAVYLLWQQQNSPTNALSVASPDGSAIRLLYAYHPKDVEYLDTFAEPQAW